LGPKFPIIIIMLYQTMINIPIYGASAKLKHSSINQFFLKYWFLCCF